jgi:hypothetical protein
VKMATKLSGAGGTSPLDPPARQNRARARSVFSRELALAAARGSFPKLDPRLQVRNPVMFIVEVGSVITTVIFFADLFRGRTGQLWQEILSRAEPNVASGVAKDPDATPFRRR